LKTEQFEFQIISQYVMLDGCSEMCHISGSAVYSVFLYLYSQNDKRSVHMNVCKLNKEEKPFEIAKVN